MEQPLARIPFGPSETTVLKGVAAAMVLLAILHFAIGLGGAVLGACGVAGGVVAAREIGGTALIAVAQMLFLAVAAVVLAGQGVLLLRARRSFQLVVATDDADQAHLTSAFEKLRLFFGIEIALGVVSLVFTVLGLVHNLVAPMPAALPMEAFP